MTADNEQSNAEVSKRWIVDSEGRSVYFPYGKARSGYIVTDPAREGALRDADRRFEEISKQIAPYGALLLLPVTFGFYYFSASYPRLAYLLFPAAFALFAVAIWLLRRPKLASLLAGLPTAPPADVAAQKVLRLSGYLLLGLITLIVLVVYLYDLRVAAAAANSRTIDFYPDITQYLIFGSLSALFVFLVIARWNGLLASPRVGPNRAMLSLFLFGIGTIGFFTAAAWNFYDPEPKVVLSRDTLYCQWRAGWTDITKVNLQSGRRGNRYLRVEFAANRSPFPDRRLTESCKIDGLNATSHEIYRAVRTRWQVASQGAPARDPSPGSATGLRVELDQLPLGSSREKVLAVLGEPILSGPSGHGVVALYPRTAAGASSDLLGDEASSRRVIAVYFDEGNRIERIALYGLNGGKIIDDLSQATLTAGYEYPVLRNVLLNPRRHG